jgi:hypothetical protein
MGAITRSHRALMSMAFRSAPFADAVKACALAMAVGESETPADASAAICSGVPKRSTMETETDFDMMVISY